MRDNYKEIESKIIDSFCAYITKLDEEGQYEVYPEDSIKQFFKKLTYHEFGGIRIIKSPETGKIHRIILRKEI